jgi:hypothetical protein
MGANASSYNKVTQKLESLNEAVTTILTKNTTSINNNQNISQSLNFTNGAGGKIDCSNITLAQRAALGLDTSISSSIENNTDISNALESQINAVVKQMAEATAELFGGSASSTNITDLSILAKNIISNNVNVSNIAQVLTVQSINQDMNFINYGEIKCGAGGTLKLDQNADIKSATSVIMTTVSKQLVDNKEIIRIVTDIENKAKATAELGVGLAIVLVAIVCCVILGGSYVIGKSLKWVIIFAIIMLVVNLILGFTNTWPYNSSSKWGCVKTGDFNTGKCAEQKDGLYGNEADCKTGCTQFWGCGLPAPTKVNGKDKYVREYEEPCKQYKSVADADGLGFVNNTPYRTQDECTKAGMCARVYGCTYADPGVESPAKCSKYNQDEADLPTSHYKTDEECKASTCYNGVWFRPVTSKKECAITRVAKKDIPPAVITYPTKSECMAA